MKDFLPARGEQFSQKINIERHMRVHNNEKLFQCIACKAHYLQREHLEVHMKIHTGEKKFKCDVCDQLFLLNLR